MSTPSIQCFTSFAICPLNLKSVLSRTNPVSGDDRRIWNHLAGFSIGHFANFDSILPLNVVTIKGEAVTGDHRIVHDFLGDGAKVC
jgi:hypothetical protein